MEYKNGKCSWRMKNVANARERDRHIHTAVYSHFLFLSFLFVVPVCAVRSCQRSVNSQLSYNLSNDSTLIFLCGFFLFREFVLSIGRVSLYCCFWCLVLGSFFVSFSNFCRPEFVCMCLFQGAWEWLQSQPKIEASGVVIVDGGP